MHCYHMALSLFKILTIFGNFAKGCDSFFKMAQKADSARPYFTIKNSIYQKGLTSCRTSKASLQAFFVPKSTCYSFKFLIEIKKEEREKKRGGGVCV